MKIREEGTAVKVKQYTYENVPEASELETMRENVGLLFCLTFFLKE